MWAWPRSDGLLDARGVWAWLRDASERRVGVVPTAPERAARRGVAYKVAACGRGLETAVGGVEVRPLGAARGRGLRVVWAWLGSGGRCGRGFGHARLVGVARRRQAASWLPRSERRGGVAYEG